MGILDSLTKNPSLIALAALGIGLFIFRDKISQFVSGATGGAETVSNLGQTGSILSGNLLGNLTGLQDIFKGVSDFKFPEIKFPEIKFPDFEFPSINLDVFQPIGTSDITETPAAVGRASDRGRNVFTQTTEEAQREIENFNVQTGLDTGQQFQGGGLSFIGGSVSEIPIERLSLGQIIERFNVSASKAADIRARARDDFNDFDFGTNTGSGIGSIIPPEVQNVGQTSNPTFAGLTPMQIAQLLTGGNISNF